MDVNVFETWTSDRWATEVEMSVSELPDSAHQAVRLVYCEGHSYEAAAAKSHSQPKEMLVQSVLAVRLIQEHLQRAHATIEPPWPRTGTGVPGAPIPRHKAVIAALRSLAG